MRPLRALRDSDETSSKAAFCFYFPMFIIIIIIIIDFIDSSFVGGGV